jgi:excinuclease ABC subunit A
VIKTADWLIDLGPEGGEGGGLIVAEGTPEQVAENRASYTGAFLKKILSKSVPPNRAFGEAVHKISRKTVRP